MVSMNEPLRYLSGVFVGWMENFGNFSWLAIVRRHGALTLFIDNGGAANHSLNYGRGPSRADIDHRC